MKSDEDQIRQVLLDRDCAMGSKDLNALMTHYSPEMVSSYAIPPFQSRGAEAFRQAWESCLPCFPNSFSTETRDLCIAVGGM